MASRHRRMLRSPAGRAACAIGLLLLANTARAADVTAGAADFKQRCSSCHSMVAGATGGIGPNLAGIAGRRAGTARFDYTAALRASGLTWDVHTLSAYLAAPGKLVPGTRMPIATPDATQRGPLVSYLMTAGK